MAYSPTQALAPRDLLVLVELARGPNHGYGLIKAVSTRSRGGVRLDPANLYRVLRRMRQTGWIVETDDTPSDRAAPVRRTYAISDRGRRVLEGEVARLESLLQQARPALAESEHA